MYKFLQLLKSNKRKEIINLENFCMKAFKKLEQPLTDMHQNNVLILY